MKEKELIDLEHKYRMEEIEARKRADIEVCTAQHERNLELLRIKSAEIRKSQLRRGEGFKY